MVEDAKTPAELYLDLLKKCLTRYVFGEDYVPAIPPKGTFKYLASEPIRRWLAGKKMEVIRYVPFDEPTRREGRDWPAQAESMIGLYRLDNLQRCIVDVLRRRVPGDLIEAGAWRGGATIFMRGVLAAYGDTGRRVWVADSFQGLPRPDPERFPTDAGDKHWTWDQLAVPLEEVQANFARYGLLDDQVRFLPGWFRDTLPAAPIDRLAVLRLDGDMYESTTDALESLYPKLSEGGFCVIDDYGLPGCRRAVDDYRAAHRIDSPFVESDWHGAFWRKG